ncbi:cytochrome P450 [Sphingomonas sp. SRS2]|uniref:cytochrome P450 n=1 Tax=Sphingomonas sp. SRS2 TaxID=133190 RepID=UPI000A91A5EF|nr:cytochrome P450 [Sphingomonas sp. SRS2]
MLETVDLDDPNFLNDRRGSYRKLRTESPVALANMNGEPAVVVTRYNEVSNILQNPDLCVQPAANAFPARIGNGPAAHFYKLSIVSLDAPDHTRLRKILTPVFSPGAVARMTEWMTEIIDRRLEEISGETEIDVVSRLGETIPADVACRLLHVPEADIGMMIDRANDINAIFSQGDLDAETLARTDAAGKFFVDYFEEHIRAKRGLPEKDFMGALLNAEEAGALDKEELTSAIVDAFIGSYHTTMVGLTNAVNALSLFPDQQRVLREDPSLGARGWEEVLRFEPPSHFRHRYVREPFTILGHEVQPGVRILLGLASANWDGDVYEDPDVFNIERPSIRHMSFGGGRHFCLGSQISRLEGKIFLPRFVQTFSDFGLAGEAEPRQMGDLSFVYSTKLNVALTPSH